MHAHHRHHLHSACAPRRSKVEVSRIKQAIKVSDDPAKTSKELDLDLTIKRCACKTLDSVLV